VKQFLRLGYSSVDILLFIYCDDVVYQLRMIHDTVRNLILVTDKTGRTDQGRGRAC